MPARKSLVLVVDDDVHMVRMMKRILELEGYRVISALNGETALGLFEEECPDLVLLDIMMPGMDGCAVCRRIREFWQVPIILVTAKGSDQEKVEGLDAGADDYVSKPFSSKELTARVRAALRRTRLGDERPEPTFRAHDLAVDFVRHRVTLGREELDLTATEFGLLSYLVRHAGRVVTPDQILEAVWGEGYVGKHHLLRVTLGRLRQKLRDDPKEPRFISTKIGMGYMFLKPE